MPGSLGEIALVPGTGGAFEVWLEGEHIGSRREEGRFPEAKELKRSVRDRIAAGRDLVHLNTLSAYLTKSAKG